MIDTMRRRVSPATIRSWLVIAAVLFAAAYLGRRASLLQLFMLLAGMGGVVLLGQPVLGLLSVVVAALAVPLEFATGTTVQLNIATLLIPALLVIWLLDMMRRRDLRLVPSRTTAPLLLFLLLGLISMLVGNAIWDPIVPRPGSFTLVQLSQWAIFAFSCGAFWLTGNLVREEVWLRRLTTSFLLLAQ